MTGNFLSGFDLVSIGIALLVATIGMFAHYFKRWVRRETQDSLLDYLFAGSSWKHTVSAAMTVYGAVIGLFAIGPVDMSSVGGIIALFTVGYAGDSAINKGADKEDDSPKEELEAKSDELAEKVKNE